MKSIFTLVLMLSSLTTQAATLVVSEGFQTKYYAEFVAPKHALTALRFFNETLKKYDCVEGTMTGTIKVKAKSPIFGKATPGDYYITYNTRCFSPDLTKVRFFIDSIGYDEDYTQIVLQLTTKSGVKLEQICAYGLDYEVRKCPESESKTPQRFSTSIPAI